MSRTQEEQPADSIASEEQHSKKKDKKEKDRRPPNTAFRQQRLKAWQPILTPKTVLPLFFAIGVIFAPIGGLLIYASSQVEEITIDYTHCFDKAPVYDSNATDAVYPPPSTAFTQAGESANIPSEYISSYFKTTNNSGTPAQWLRSTHPYNFSSNVGYDLPTCHLQFQIPNNIGPPVLLYYRMTNFYQNHRRYVKSLDADQLQGKARTAKQIGSSDCDPLQLNPDGKPYYPCGLIANSLFNDTYNITYLNAPGGSSQAYHMTNQGIAWDSDKDLYKNTSYGLSDVVPPPNWHMRYPNGYTETEPFPNLNQWEEFQVWMRTAGLPTFSKLALRNDNETMEAGRYQIDLYDNFKVVEYDGTKSILISTRTVMGGKNPFLGIAYVVVGGICILLGFIFTATHLIKPRKLGDHTYLTWNQDQGGRAARPGN